MNDMSLISSKTTDETGKPIQDSYWNIKIKREESKNKQNLASEKEVFKELNSEHELFFEVELSIEEGKVIYSHSTEVIKYDNLK